MWSRGYKEPSRALRAPYSNLISKIIGFDLPTCGILYIRVLKLSISTPQVGKGARRARVTFLSGHILF